MSRTRTTASRLVAVLVTLLLGAVTLALVPARADQVARTHNDTRAVSAAPVEVDVPIEYFGLVADLAPGVDHPQPQGSAPFGEARFRVGGRWTPWQSLGEDGAQAAGQFTGALVSVDRADAYQVRAVPAWGLDWRAAAITTSNPASAGPLPTATAAGTSDCMSRADWGADESISGWVKDGDTHVFSAAQVMTVHHTATSNSTAQDYAATVRAIYSFHVQSNGWSDIGYQYLIDAGGVLYEGRGSGHTSLSCQQNDGNGSDFAHEAGTDRVVTGAHALGYNSGNLGIALIGCFQKGGGCSGATTPTTAAVDALVEHVAHLSARHGLDVDGTTTYTNPLNGNISEDVALLSGHQDWNATSCPGTYLDAKLPTIRARAAGTSQAPAPAAITSATCRSATCTFGGTGVEPLAWDLGNGTVAQGATAKTTYATAGTYPITLTDAQPSTATRVVVCTTARKGASCKVQ